MQLFSRFLAIPRLELLPLMRTYFHDSRVHIMYDWVSQSAWWLRRYGQCKLRHEEYRFWGMLLSKQRIDLRNNIVLGNEEM